MMNDDWPLPERYCPICDTAFEPVVLGEFGDSWREVGFMRWCDCLVRR